VVHGISASGDASPIKKVDGGPPVKLRRRRAIEARAVPRVEPTTMLADARGSSPWRNDGYSKRRSR